jgi:hypothetical protein
MKINAAAAAASVVVVAVVLIVVGVFCEPKNNNVLS